MYAETLKSIANAIIITEFVLRVHACPFKDKKQVIH